MTNMFFVGVKRSALAIKKGWSWRDGRLAAKQLFDALRALGIDPVKMQYGNWWSSSVTRQKIRTFASKGGLVVALGKDVDKALSQEAIPHVTMFHPAARGHIRRKDNYQAHVKAVLAPHMDRMS